MAKPNEGSPRRIKKEQKRFSNDALIELAKLYWKHLLITTLISLTVWIFAVFSPRFGITIPTLFFMPTLYTIVLAFVRDPGRDRAQAFSFSVIIGFIFFIIVTAISPLMYQWLNPDGG